MCVTRSRLAAARRQRLTVVLSRIGTLAAAGLASFTNLQRAPAIRNEQEALTKEGRAAENQLLAEHQRDAAQTNESLRLTSVAENEPSLFC